MPRGPMMQRGMQAMPKVRKGTVPRLMKYLFEGYKAYWIIVALCIVASSISGVIANTYLQELIDDCIIPGRQRPPQDPSHDGFDIRGRRDSVFPVHQTGRYNHARHAQTFPRGYVPQDGIVANQILRYSRSRRHNVHIYQRYRRAPSDDRTEPAADFPESYQYGGDIRNDDILQPLDDAVCHSRYMRDVLYRQNSGRRLGEIHDEPAAFVSHYGRLYRRNGQRAEGRQSL